MRRIECSSLILEPQTAGHAREMFAVLSDPAIYEFENEPPPAEKWLAERYAKLESRCSPDGSERWLNWVIRTKEGPLAGYVQATVRGDGTCLIAYELNSRFWRRGIGREAVSAMLAELAATYGTRHYVAVLKRANFRSAGLLAALGFSESPRGLLGHFHVSEDEMLLARQAENPD